MIVIPENIFLNYVEGVLNHLYIDIQNSGSAEDTILYGIFGDLEFKRIKYFDHAKKVFDRSNSNPRRISIKLSFDTDFSSPPIVYITTGKDDHKYSPIGHYDGSEDLRTNGGLINRQILSTRISGETNIVIVSDNLEEMLIIYHSLRAMLLASIPTLVLSGIQEPNFGGNDVMLNEEMIPKNIFIRTISVRYEYEISVPSFAFGLGVITGLTSNGTPNNG